MSLFPCIVHTEVHVYLEQKAAVLRRQPTQVGRRVCTVLTQLPEVYREILHLHSQVGRCLNTVPKAAICRPVRFALRAIPPPRRPTTLTSLTLARAFTHLQRTIYLEQEAQETETQKYTQVFPLLFGGFPPLVPKVTICICMYVCIRIRAHTHTHTHAHTHIMLIG